MKLIEKLAKEYLESRRDYSSYYENDYCQNNYSDMRGAYAEGFRKAREMATEKLDKFTLNFRYQGRLMVPGYGVHESSASTPLGKALLETLGEEEVQSCPMCKSDIVGFGAACLCVQGGKP